MNDFFVFRIGNSFTALGSIATCTLGGHRHVYFDGIWDFLFRFHLAFFSSVG